MHTSPNEILSAIQAQAFDSLSPSGRGRGEGAMMVNNGTPGPPHPPFSPNGEKEPEALASNRCVHQLAPSRGRPTPNSAWSQQNSRNLPTPEAALRPPAERDCA